MGVGIVGKAAGFLFNKVVERADKGLDEVYLQQAPQDVTVVRNLDYAGEGDPLRLLDVHFPNHAAHGGAPLPVVIYIHGGGWVYGPKELNSGFCNRIAHEGYVVFNLNYRLAPESAHPAQIMDVLAGIQYAKEHASAYHGDASRFFFAGDSAGAHLASLAGAICTNRKLAEIYEVTPPVGPDEICGLLFFCGVFLTRDGKTKKIPSIIPNMLVDAQDHRELAYSKAITPIGNMTEDYPPCFLVSSEADAAYPHSQRMLAAMQKTDVDYESHIYSKQEHPQAKHEFQLKDGLACAKDCRQALWKWMKQHSETPVKTTTV